jgi:uncharacterized protein (TIRG00374 family)
MLGIAFGLLWLSFRGVDLESTFREFDSIEYSWLGLSVFASVIAFLSRAYRWNLLITPLGYRPRLYDTMNAVMVGYIANLAVPRLGEVTRCGSLTKTSKVPFDMLLGTVIVERVLDVFCLGCCFIITAWIEHDRLGNFLYDNLFGPLETKWSSISGNMLIILAVALLVMGAVIILLIRRSRNRHLPGMQRFTGLLKGILQGLRSVRNIEKKGAFIFHTVLIWFLYFLMSYTCFKALPATSSLSWQAGMFVLVAGGMGMAAPVQGGIGAYHWLVSRGLILFGLTQVHGLAFATLMHTTQTLLVILMGAISLLLISLQTVKSGSNA